MSTFGQVKETKRPTTMKVAMTSIFVSDPDKAFKFYTDTLGFKEVLYNKEARLAIVASPLEPDGTALLLEPNEKEFAKNYQETLYEKGLPVIVFSTEDIQKEYERLKKAGVKFKKKPTKTQWGIDAIFNDNQGNWIQLQEMPYNE